MIKTDNGMVQHGFHDQHEHVPQIILSGLNLVNGIQNIDTTCVQNLMHSTLTNVSIFPCLYISMYFGRFSLIG